MSATTDEAVASPAERRVAPGAERRSSPPRRLPWIAMAVVVMAALAVGTVAQPQRSDAQRAYDVAGQIRCPSCAGQAANTSDAPAAQAVRTIVADGIAAGDSDEEITNRVVAQYPGTRLDPTGSGFSALVWALPAGLVVIALVALWFRFRDWRPGSLTVSDDDRALVADALAGDPSAEARS